MHRSISAWDIIEEAIAIVQFRPYLKFMLRSVAMYIATTTNLSNELSEFRPPSNTISVGVIKLYNNFAGKCCINYARCSFVPSSQTSFLNVFILSLLLLNESPTSNRQSCKSDNEISGSDLDNLIRSVS